ncbi:hypothetical protein ACS5NO_12820 [Larkinella sp. GY13]|uniref:hypothetical protein n=1 Tax=Larkinella sp. GY13 TaxID=3453720 RepID=UPI003EE96CA1
MKTFELDGVSYQMPQSWDEIPAPFLPKWIKLIYLTPATGAMYHELLRLALGVSAKRWKKLQQKHFGANLPDWVRRKNAEVLHQLIRWLAWAWEQPVDRQPVEFLKVDRERWLLPEPGLVSTSFGELTDLYIHLQAFIQPVNTVEATDAMAALDSLVATACRPHRPLAEMMLPDWNGDRREAYNEFIARQRSQRVAVLPFDEKLPILLYVTSSIKAVLDKYTLFDPADAGGDSTETYAGQGFIKNGHLLAEKGIFGTLKQTQQANAHEVLLFLEEHRQDALTAYERQKQADQ